MDFKSVNNYAVSPLSVLRWSHLPIETIRLGDRVWASDLVADSWKLRSVLQNFVTEYRADMVHVTVAGETIQATMLHPFWVNEGRDLPERPFRSHLGRAAGGITGHWSLVDATDLRAGDKVLTRDGREGTVESVRHVPADTVVYNFAVDELQCYAVGNQGILVHNSNGLIASANGWRT